MNGATAKRIRATSFAQPADETTARGHRSKQFTCNAFAIIMRAKGSNPRKRLRRALQSMKSVRSLHGENGIRYVEGGHGRTEMLLSPLLQY
jgi:hypothetical protein